MVDEEEPSARTVARRLSASDPVLARIIRRVGPTELPRRIGGFPSLVRSIVFQQISGAAGESILRKVEAAYGREGFPGAEWFLDASPDTLARAGLSPQKRSYLVDLARRVRDRDLDFDRIRTAPDPDVVDALTEVHGIGRWTAQMYLIFSLGRPDVLPTGDLGVRKAVERAWGFRTLPAERTVERIGRKWAPYRSYAAYYLWRSLELPPEAGSARPRPAAGATLRGALGARRAARTRRPRTASRGRSPSRRSSTR